MTYPTIQSVITQHIADLRYTATSYRQQGYIAGITDWPYVDELEAKAEALERELERMKKEAT